MSAGKTDFRADGLPASWLNGWLAALGATVLDPRIYLRWSKEHPIAILSAAGVDPISILTSSWPSRAFLSELPIAEHWHGAATLKRQVSIDDFQTRARAARGHPHAWTLSSTLTDLCITDQGNVTHAPFDPSGPGPIKWLHHRLLKVWDKANVSENTLRLSLVGCGKRVTDNGLGFDHTRLGSLADDSKITALVDPIIEVLVFFGLALFPVRGRGIDGRVHRHSEIRPVQRGWRDLPKASWCFCWPAWTQALNRDGIDAILDAWKPEKARTWSRLGIQAGWRTVRYKSRGVADPTKAYGSERL